MNQTTEGSVFQTPEWKLIITGCVIGTVTLIGIALSFVLGGKGLGSTLISAFGLHLIGFRAPAVFLCLHNEFNPLFTLFYNFIVEVIIVLVAYPTFILIMRDGVEARLFHMAARKAEAAAMANMTTVKKFGMIGLFAFVLFPFAMTGPITGAIIGYLLSYKGRMTLLIVFSGTFSALCVYVVGYLVLGASVVDSLKKHNDLVGLIVAVAIAVFAIYHVRTVARWVRTLGSNGDEPREKHPELNHEE